MRFPASVFTTSRRSFEADRGAGSRNFYSLQDAVQRYYGYPHLVPTHQGRGAEHILSRILISPGDHVPGNMYFTTTRAHLELAGAVFHDVIIDEAHDPASEHPFKGNVDLTKFDVVVRRYGAAHVPYVSVAATVNMAGGQPVSLANLRDVREYTRRQRITIILDATRAVENAWFIQQREPGQRDRLVADILREMCELTDGATRAAITTGAQAFHITFRAGARGSGGSLGAACLFRPHQASRRRSFSPLCVKRTPSRYGASPDGTSPDGVVTIASPSLSANDMNWRSTPSRVSMR